MFAKLIIRDFRKIERADVPLSEKVTIFGGKNRKGKSSTALALTAVLNTTPNVIYQQNICKIKKKEDLKKLVRRGARGGLARIETADSFYEMHWPSGDPALSGIPPHASKYATNLISFLDLDEKTKADELNRLLETTPTHSEIVEALDDIGYCSDEAVALSVQIKQHGWPGALKIANYQGVRIKSEWERVTGRAFQPTKGIDWLPEVWDDELAQSTLEGLTELVQVHQRRHEIAKANLAVSEADYQALAEKAKLVEKFGDEFDKASIDKTTTQKALEAERYALSQFGNPNSYATIFEVNCLHCSEPNKYVLRDGKLVDYDGEQPDKEKIAAKVEEQRARVAELDKLATAAYGLFAVAERNFAEATRAHQRIEEIDLSGKTGSQAAVEEAEALLEEATGRLKAFKNKHLADDLYKQSNMNWALQKLLDATGLRKTKMLKALDAFNARLEALCEAAGWPLVQLDESLECQLDGEPDWTCSKSEQFILQWILSIAIAQIDGSSMVILDGADIFDHELRSQLAKALKFASLPAAVFITANSTDDIPDPAESKHGLSYWIDAERITPVGAVYA